MNIRETGSNTLDNSLSSGLCSRQRATETSRRGELNQPVSSRLRLVQKDRSLLPKLDCCVHLLCQSFSVLQRPRLWRLRRECTCFMSTGPPTRHMLRSARESMSSLETTTPSWCRSRIRDWSVLFVRPRRKGDVLLDNERRTSVAGLGSRSVSSNVLLRTVPGLRWWWMMFHGTRLRDRGG